MNSPFQHLNENEMRRELWLYRLQLAVFAFTLLGLGALVRAVIERVG